MSRLNVIMHPPQAHISATVTPFRPDIYSSQLDIIRNHAPLMRDLTSLDPNHCIEQSLRDGTHARGTDGDVQISAFVSDPKEIVSEVAHLYA